MNNCQNDDIIITVDENSDDVILVEENTVLPEKKKNIFSEFFSIFPVHACLCCQAQFQLQPQLQLETELALVPLDPVFWCSTESSSRLSH